MRYGSLAGFVLMATLQAGCGNSGHHDNDGLAPIAYPVTKRDDAVESHFGKTIADPYRWLENDPLQDRDVAAWIQAQRQTTSKYLDTLPGRDAFRSSLKSAFNYERVSAPQKAGGRYFYTRKDGTQDQAALYVRDTANVVGRLLIDPAEWADDGSVTFMEWSVSADGAYVAYAVQESGSDWRTIRVLDVATGQPLADELKWARLTQIAWAKDGSGFYYSRYPEPNGSAGLSNHAAYFHRLGTAQSQDKLFYATPEHPERMNTVGVTSDGRYAIVYSSADLVHAAVTVVDLQSSDQAPRKLIAEPAEVWSFFANVGTKLYLITNRDAERSKIVTFDLAAPEPEFVDLIPQQDGFLTSAHLIGGRLLVCYLVDAKSEVMRYTLEGAPDGAMTFPGIGSVRELTGDASEPEAFVQFESFNQPKTVYRYDVSKNTSDIWVEPNLDADLEQLRVDQVFYASRDGARIPMFIVRRKDVVGPAPTVLMGYGAFAVNLAPAYSPMLTGWLLQGGVIAIPNIRGGGEFGAPWHEAGRGERKHNSFDDFVAAAEYLHANSVARAGGITAYGDSAGGLLVGAVVNRRPDLFGAALPSVGVMDMLRYNRFTGGQLWVGEYGDPAVEADFNNLLSYSPYHNVRVGKSYPAILATTGEGDTRVTPAHSYKYVAALQASNPGAKPHLIRIDARAGHGAGKPTTQMIEEAADMWAFAARWTGLKVENAR